MVRLNTLLLAPVAALLPSTSASSVYDFLGPGYPAPLDISSHQSPAALAWDKAIADITSYLSSGKNLSSYDPKDQTFSIAAFSLEDPNALSTLQFHHTSPSLSNSTHGTRKADADSVYRIGSISKVFTVYATLAKLGSSYWSRPVTDFVPQLKQTSNLSESNPINYVDWSAVTLGELAGQLSGITRDIIEIATQFPEVSVIGLPSLNYSDPIAVACGDGDTNLCNEKAFLKEIIDRPPVFAPGTTPTYSNAGYNILAIALSKIVGQSFDDIVEQELLTPLRLGSSGVGIPRNATNVVNVGDNFTNWESALGYSAPAGGFYSSVNDISKLALSIMNSTLLSAGETREWLKPVTHTADLRVSVGRPWEILRYTQPVTQRVNDLYTKSGDVDFYSAELIMSPDHKAGFVVLTAGESVGSLPGVLSDIIADSFLPGLEAAAAKQASEKIAGMYTHNSGSKQNSSSLCLKVDPQSGPGLIIDSWTMNGKEPLAVIAEGLGMGALNLRLYPTDLEMAVSSSFSSSNSSAIRRQAFRAAITLEDTPPPSGPVSQMTSSEQWILADIVQYAKRAIDSFIIEFDANGTAISVLPSAFRETLVRET